MRPIPRVDYHSVSARKGDFLPGRSAHGWQDAPWTWVKDRVRPDDVKVELLVWDMDGQPAHDELGGAVTDFARRSHADAAVKMAHAEAKRLVREGIAVSAEVVVKVYSSGVGYGRIEAWTYRMGE